MDSFLTISGANTKNYRQLLQGTGSLDFVEQTESWVNYNWINPDDAHGMEVVALMKEWIPVRVPTATSDSERLG